MEFIFRPFTFKDIYNNPQYFNIKNLHEYDPYIYDDKYSCLVLDEKWWNSLPHIVITQLNKIKYFQINDIQIPHILYDNPLIYDIRRIYMESYDPQFWSTDVIKIPISKTEKSILEQLTLTYLTDESIENVDFSKLSSLQTKIEKVIDNTCSYNIRLAGDARVEEPVSSVEQILLQLITNIPFLYQEYQYEHRKTFLTLTKSHNVEKRNEFRVFVHRYKITAVSQQHLKNAFNYSATELHILKQSINKLNASNIIYKNCVIDVWIDFINIDAHIIDYKPVGAYSNTESRLFHWINDNDRLFGDGNQIEIRIVIEDIKN